MTTNRERCLHLLQEAEGRWVTTGDFLHAGCGSRFGARLMELREQGHEIESELERPGSWRYRLVGARVGGGSGNSAPQRSASPAADLSVTAADEDVAIREPVALFRDYTDPKGQWMEMPLSELGIPADALAPRTSDPAAEAATTGRSAHV